MSGARLDLGQTDAALAELEIPELDPTTAYSYSPALFDAYATVLEELGRDDRGRASGSSGRSAHPMRSSRPRTRATSTSSRSSNSSWIEDAPELDVDDDADPELDGEDAALA